MRILANILVLAGLIVGCSSAVTTDEVASEGGVELDGTVAGNPLDEDGTVAGNPVDDDGTVAGNPSSDLRMLTGTVLADGEGVESTVDETQTVEVVFTEPTGDTTAVEVAVGEEFSVMLALDTDYEVNFHQSGKQVGALHFPDGHYFAGLFALVEGGSDAVSLGDIAASGSGVFSPTVFPRLRDEDAGDYNLNGHIDSFEGLGDTGSTACAVSYLNAFNDALVEVSDSGTATLTVGMNADVAQIDASKIILREASGGEVVMVGAASSQIDTQSPTRFSFSATGLSAFKTYILYIPNGSVSCMDGSLLEKTVQTLFETTAD